MMRWDDHLIRHVKSSKTTLRKLFHTAKSLRRKQATAENQGEARHHPATYDNGARIDAATFKRFI